jgi:branched-chain amino acid transport system substrate-binding protein
MKKLKIVKILFGLMLLLILINSKSYSEEIILGQSAAFQGSSAILGTELWKGANAYFSFINSQGGVNGRKIKVLSLNDDYEGKKTLENTIDLIQNKNVFALFGYVGTPTIVEALPAIQKFSKDDVFLFSNFTGAQPQRELPHSSYVFNVRTSYRLETLGLVKLLHSIGKRKFGLFIQYDSYGRAGADGVQRALREKKLDVVAETTYQRGVHYGESMSSQVQALMKANTEVVISVGSYAACAAFIRDAREAGFKGIIANLSFVGPDAMLRLLLNEEKIKNKKFTQNLINTQAVPPPSDKSIKLVNEYQDIMKKFGVNYSGKVEEGVDEYTFTSLEGFLNAKVFVEILKKIKGQVTRKSFYNVAKKTHNLDVGLGGDKLSFDNLASQGLSVVYYTTIEANKYVTIKNWNQFK